MRPFEPIMPRRCRRTGRAAVVCAALWMVGCADEPRPADSGIDAAASESDAGLETDAGPNDAGADAGPNDAGADAGPNDAGADAGPTDAGSPDQGAPDLGPPGPITYDVRVLADGFCDMLSFDPPSISVPAGTEFHVNWINATGCTEIDIDKNGDVPIVIGLPSGGSYDDTVHPWCGIFTGTFYFRAYYSWTYTFSLPVDCDG